MPAKKKKKEEQKKRYAVKVTKTMLVDATVVVEAGSELEAITKASFGDIESLWRQSDKVLSLSVNPISLRELAPSEMNPRDACPKCEFPPEYDKECGVYTCQGVDCDDYMRVIAED